MAFNGLLQGVMQGIQGGADAGVYAAKGLFDDQRKVDVSKQLADIEEEKLLRIDEIKRERDIRDIPLKGAADTQVAVDRGNNKEYLGALRNEAKAKHVESAGSVAQANLSNYELNKRKETDALISDIDAAAQAGDVKTVDRLMGKLNMINGNKYGQRYDKAIVEDESGAKQLVVVDKVTGQASQPIIQKPGKASNAATNQGADTRKPLSSYKTNQD